MAQRETVQPRASQVPLDYHRPATRLEKWKFRLLLLGVAVPAAWWALEFARGDRGDMLYSRGPVASVHAAWEENCYACHVPFTPVRGATWAGVFVHDPLASNERCRTCHAGPAHHTNQKPELACASCHRDHQGRDFALARGIDHDCTQCHDDLAPHRDGPGHFEERVRRFTANDHPEFRPLKERDPGQLTFNHARHLTAGMVLTEGGKPWTLADIRDPEERKRYTAAPWQRDRSDTAAVTLDCAACHRLDSRDGPSDQPPRSAGATMLPIHYDSHCKACHPLTVNPTPGEADAAPIVVPHRLQPDEVRDFLWGACATRLAGKDPELFPPQPRRPFPGKDVPAEEERIRKEIDVQVRAAEGPLYRQRVGWMQRLLFSGRQTCSECHVYQLPALRDVPVKIYPPAIPSVWYRHARFDHTAHRALDCLACHDQAKRSETSADVLLPGIGNCLQCHSPRTESGGLIRGGARFDCAECHRYHQGDEPLAGNGSAARGAPRRVDVQKFLSGR